MAFRGTAFAFNSPDAAIGAIVSRLRGFELRAEPVPLFSASGRVLAQEVRLDRDSPAFDHAAMDGYAVNASWLASVLADAPVGLVLPVVGQARIGAQPPTLATGVVRIATGAPMPRGADAVLKREDVIEHADPSGEVTTIGVSGATASKVRATDHVRARAENARAGEVLLRPGDIIDAAATGVLASVGVVKPLVRRRMRVAVLSTGDELVSPDQSPDPYQVRNSNASVLRAALTSTSSVELVGVAHARDDGEELSAMLNALRQQADLVVLSGGVSMGHRDLVRETVESAGAEIIFHGLPQRPGKPILGAVFPPTSPGARVIFGLPGNPVSALITCVRIVLPVVEACMSERSSRNVPRMPLASTDGKSLDLWWHRLVRFNESGELELTTSRGSGDLISAARSDGFIEVPPGPTLSGVAYPYFAWPRGAAATAEECER